MRSEEGGAEAGEPDAAHIAFVGSWALSSEGEPWVVSSR